ncbi:Uncharacterised protein [Mycobacteroides abscessus]|nr:Uncharacterised protein [Mycobacteroides abscessus]
MDANPICTTSTPWAVTPSVNACAREGEESRISRPTTTRSALDDSAESSRSALINRANDDPTSKTKDSSICSPSRPRTSYALMTAWTASADRAMTRALLLIC